MRHSKLLPPVSLLLLFIANGLVQADLIDFETGFSRLDAVSSVTTATNVVTFITEGVDNTPPFIAQVGTTPKDAFEKVVDRVKYGDTPAGGDPGDFFVTDGAGNTNHYLFDLDVSVSEFSLDLYDYVGDGGAAPTDFATLRAFSDTGRTIEVATDLYVVPKPRPADGLAVTLSVSAPSISALTLEFSTLDRGTGIDNIQFVTVPEPSAIALMTIAVSCMTGYGWRRRRHVASR